MRTILGALIGLGLGVALIAVLAVSGGWDGYWTMIPVGLVVGIAMRAIASQGNASIGRGVLALLAAMGALPIGQMVAKEVISNQSPTKASMPAAVASAEPAEGATDAAADETPEVAPRTPAPTGPSDGAPLGAIGAPKANATSPVDIVCLVIGALLSYQIGKGPEGGSAAPEEEGEGQPEGGEDAAPESGDSGEES